MIDPINIFIIALTVAFLLGLMDKLSKNLSGFLFYAALLSFVVISGQWLLQIMSGSIGKMVFTAGYKPPYSINLFMGRIESFLTFCINLVGLFSAIYLFQDFTKNKFYNKVLFLMLIMGLNGLVLTRDLFNLFVFMEISSIATLSLVAFRDDYNALNSGLKYAIASGIASALFLLGTIFIYQQTGNLNIDAIVSSRNLLANNIGFIAVFFLIASLLIELKLFPANGWALDLYQSVNSGIVSVIAVANSAAIIFALYKLLPLFPDNYLHIIAGAGVVTYIISNLMGLKEKKAKRLLGYSSIAQMGLLLTAIILLRLYPPLNSKVTYIILAGIFLSHFIAKAGLFWICGIVKQNNIDNWKGLKNNSLIFFIFGIFILALSGLPPFPGFWAKWELVKHLFASGVGTWVWLILLGSLLEAAYLLRWFINSFQPGELNIDKKSIKLEVVTIFSASFIFSIFYTASQVVGMSNIFFLPALIVLIFILVDFLPAKRKGFLLIAFLVMYLFYIFPQLNLLRKIFAIIFLGGISVQIIATMHSKNARRGFYPLLSILAFSLVLLLQAKTAIQFFFSWEMMTLSTWLMVMRGEKSKKASFLFIIFSLGSAYLILAGLGIFYKTSGSLLLTPALMANTSVWSAVLLSLGFLIKTGTVGFHIWLPGSYAEAEDDFSAIISPVISKSAIFGLIFTLILFGQKHIAGISWNIILGWLGGLTALAGAFMAVFQEDVKRLLAYSGMGQLGYIVLAIAINSHLGWVTALYLAINHLLFKGMIFITIAGVIARTRTRKMYEMGGLINRMPLSFISVLIGIIALSGVPPLSGFGGKWMLYTALIEKGWYLQAGLAFFAGAVAFLYCYRLIHSIFLGQLKPKFNDLQEAPIWFHISSYIFIAGVMAISTFPNLILKPLITAVNSYFPTSVNIEGYSVISSLGYWNGNAIMLVTMGIFMILLIFMLTRIKSVTKVKQFNIVYAAERPDRPGTSHVAYNFFAPYQKALGFLAKGQAAKLWQGISEAAHTLASLFRSIYTGQAQTYALYILVFVVLLYFIMGVF